MTTEEKLAVLEKQEKGILSRLDLVKRLSYLKDLAEKN